MPLTDLELVLRSLEVECDDISYGFATTSEEIVSKEVLAIFREKEGISITAETSYLDKNNISYDGNFAKLSLKVQTSLKLVGLTAEISKVLAINNLPANIVAASKHDHIFVPYERKSEAIKIIEKLRDNYE